MGRWPWAAPLGYVNDLKLSNGANITPDPSSPPLVREAFELYATGKYTKIQVLKIITDKGLKTKRGQRLTAQTFDALLRKPIYAGWVYSSSVPEVVKGLHAPVVRQEAFDTVQRLLSGRKLSNAPKRKQNPLFPLKQFVKCGVCGTPLTGGMNKGKLKHYAQLSAVEEHTADEVDAYERLLGDAMHGDAMLFVREDAVEAAGAIVDPILTNATNLHPYEPGSWEPREADRLAMDVGGWHNPEHTRRVKVKFRSFATVAGGAPQNCSIVARRPTPFAFQLFNRNCIRIPSHWKIKA